MRGYFATVGLALLTAGLIIVPRALSQGKPPLPAPKAKTITPAQFSEMRGETSQVDWREGYRHGRFLVLSLKGNNNVSGRVVWTDEAAGKVYIRPRDGDVPVAVPFADITKAERIQLASVKEGKGGIAPASIREGQVGPAILGPQPPDTPEIHVVRVVNGDVVTEHFYSNVVSHGEQAVLHRIEAAERDLAQARDLIADLNDMMQNKQQLQEALVAQADAQTTALRILNNTARNYYWVSWYYQDPPLGIAEAYYWPTNFRNNYHHYNAPPHYYPNNNNNALAYPIIQRQQNEGESFSPGRIVEDIQVARAGLEKAQQNLAMARSRAIYEEGRIVAVRLD